MQTPKIKINLKESLPNNPIIRKHREFKNSVIVSSSLSDFNNCWQILENNNNIIIVVVVVVVVFPIIIIIIIIITLLDFALYFNIFIFTLYYYYNSKITVLCL
jgi:hypothetical protein